ncbi:hypothetical protein AAG906_025357 [Vitis piasezkii]
MEDKDTGDLFLLGLPPFVSKPSQSQSSVSKPVFEHSQIPNPRSPPIGKQVPNSTRLTLVYSRKKATIIEPVDLNLPIVVIKGTRTCTLHPLYPLSHFVSYDKLSSSHRNFLTSLDTIAIPKTLFEALNSKKWKQAMRVEMEALEKNRIWDVVELPSEKSPVGCKWVFTIKYKVDGSLER